MQEMAFSIHHGTHLCCKFESDIRTFYFSTAGVERIEIFIHLI